MNSILIISPESGMLLFGHRLHPPEKKIKNSCGVGPSNVIEMDPFQVAPSFFAIYKLSCAQSIHSGRQESHLASNEKNGEGITWIRQGRSIIFFEEVPRIQVTAPDSTKALVVLVLDSSMDISVTRRIAQQFFHEVSLWTTIWTVSTTQLSRHKKAVLAEMRVAVSKISMSNWNIISKLMNGTVTAIFYKRGTLLGEDNSSSSGRIKDNMHDGPQQHRQEGLPQKVQVQLQLPKPLRQHKKSLLNSLLVACGIVGTHQPRGSGRVFQDPLPLPSTAVHSSDSNIQSQLPLPIGKEEPPLPAPPPPLTLPASLCRKTISALVFQQDGALVPVGELLEHRQLLVALIANTEEYLASSTTMSTSSSSSYYSSSVRYVCVPSPKDILKGISDDCSLPPSDEEDEDEDEESRPTDRRKDANEEVFENDEDILLVVDVEADVCMDDVETSYHPARSSSPDGSVASNIRSAELIATTDIESTSLLPTHSQPGAEVEMGIKKSSPLDTHILPLLSSPLRAEDNHLQKSKATQFISSFLPDKNDKKKNMNSDRRFAITTYGTDTVILLSVSARADNSNRDTMTTTEDEFNSNSNSNSNSELLKELHSQILWAESLLQSVSKDSILSIP